MANSYYQPKTDYSYDRQHGYNYDYSSYPECTYTPKSNYSHYDSNKYYYNVEQCYVVIVHVDTYHAPAPKYTPVPQYSPAAPKHPPVAPEYPQYGYPTY